MFTFNTKTRFALWQFALLTVFFLSFNSALGGVAARHWQLEDGSPLMLAAKTGEIQRINELLTKGHNVNEQHAKSKATPLIFAASAGKADVVKLLLERGANPNLCSWADVCPIWWATTSGSYETVKMLIEAGGNVKQNPGVNSLEHPALHEAVIKGRSDMVKLLLDHGAEIEFTNFFAENTALAVAVRVGKTNIVQMLIERGANIGAATEVPYSEWKYHGGLSAFALAKKDGHKDTVDLVEKTLKSGRYAPPKYSVDTIMDKLYRDQKFDLSAQGKEQTDFLRKQTKETLRRIRNTIFARKNYQFDDAQLTDYFRKRFPTYKPENRDLKLSEIDKRNVRYVKEIEEYRAARDAAG